MVTTLQGPEPNFFTVADSGINLLELGKTGSVSGLPQGGKVVLPVTAEAAVAEAGLSPIAILSEDGTTITLTRPINLGEFAEYGPDVRTLTPVTDQAPPLYKRFHPGKPVPDHLRSRAVARARGESTADLPKDWKPWEWNSRKGAYEGDYVKSLEELQRQGFTLDQSKFILEDDLHWIENDVLGRTNVDWLDKIPAPDSR